MIKFTIRKREREVQQIRVDIMMYVKDVIKLIKETIDPISMIKIKMIKMRKFVKEIIQENVTEKEKKTKTDIANTIEEMTDKEVM